MPNFCNSPELAPDAGMRLIANTFTEAAVFIFFVKQLDGDNYSILQPGQALVMVICCVDAIIRMKILPRFRGSNYVARATDGNSGFLNVIGVVEFVVYCILPEDLRWAVYGPSAVVGCLYLFIGVKMKLMKELEKEKEKEKRKMRR